MHATIEQLLAVRDREPVATDINQHVNVCQLCRETLDELTLTKDEFNRLPEVPPPCDYWPDILARVEHQRKSNKQRQRRFRYSVFGLAASALLASALFFNKNIEQNDTIPAGSSNVAIGNAASTNKDTVANKDVSQTDQSLPDSNGDTSDLDTLISRSAQLEAVLHALPQRPGIVKASTADLISGLQDGVALVDYQLNLNANKLSPDQSRQLWQQRVDLMNSLVNVRYAESQRVAYSPN